MFIRLLSAAFCLLIITTADAADNRFPELTGRVVDAAQIIDAQTARQIDQQLAAHEQTTSDQIVVVTVPSLNDSPIEEYGYKLGRFWGIGQKGKNNGVLLIVAPNERKVRIEVAYGLEGVLTDAASSLIINRLMLPAFKTGDYSGGIQKGVSAVLDVIGGNNVNDIAAKNQTQSNDYTVHFWLLLLIFILFLRWLVKGRSGGMAAPFLLGSLFGGSRGGSDDDDGPSFTGGGGSFGGGGSSGSW